jgi:anti-sigma regulatory factor (Ser/Thr protein kinase)
MAQATSVQAHQSRMGTRQPWPLSAAMPPLAAIPAAASSARSLVRLTLPGWGMADLTSPAELIISELVTNAINASARQHHIRVCLLADSTLMVLEVWDEASGVPLLSKADGLDENGRGLALVDALASQWGWHPAHERPGKCVWAALQALLHPMQHSAASRAGKANTA